MVEQVALREAATDGPSPFLCVWLRGLHALVLFLGFRFNSEGLAYRRASSCRCLSWNRFKTIVYKQQKSKWSYVASAYSSPRGK